MGNDFYIKVEADHSKQVLAELDKKVALALGAIGETVEGYAKEDCPVDTGLLRNSLTYAVSGRPTNISSYAADRADRSGIVRNGTYQGIMGDEDDKAVYIGSNVQYAAKIELDGKPHAVGKSHFLRDGALKHTDELKNKTEVILKS